MTKNIKNIINNFFSFEVLSFVFVNLLILTNSFLYLNAYVTGLVGNFIDRRTLSTSVDVHINTSMGLSIMLIPVFIVIKYLALPICLLIIHKFRRNDKAKDLIFKVIRNHKLKTLLITIILDSIYCFINWLLYKSSGNYTYNINDSGYLLFGGLTGSYILLFILYFICEKFKLKCLW